MFEKVILGDAELWLGDCREVLPTLPDFDLILTDPPYGIGFTVRPTFCQRANGMRTETWDNERPGADTINLLLTKSDNAIIWGGNYFSLPVSRGWLVWLKQGNAPSMADLEMAWTSFDMNARWFEKSVRSASLEKQLNGMAHPTQKPIGLMQWCMTFAPNATSVCDPFMGSGTTGVACAQLGRKFTGIERERKYFDIACERIARAQAQGQLFAPVFSKPEQMGLAS